MTGKRNISKKIPDHLLGCIDINHANLKQYHSSGKIRDFAMFLYLKKLYRAKSSCLYEYSPNKLAADMNCCRNTAESYLRRFKANGWCIEVNGFKGRFTNILFKSPRKFEDNDEKGLIIKFEIKGDAKQIEDDLYLLTLKTKQNQFDEVKKLGQEIKTPTNANSYKRALRLTKNKNYSVDNLPDKNAKFQISIKKIAEMFNCSVGKACKIVGRLKKTGRICVERCTQIIGKSRNKQLVNGLLATNPSAYYTGQYIVLVYCNSYQF